MQVKSDIEFVGERHLKKYSKEHKSNPVYCSLSIPGAQPCRAIQCQCKLFIILWRGGGGGGGPGLNRP